ncbi:MAG: hypothetical protein IH831_04485 [Planctomycetes bacterium]|nr:hypothetical protein [Planctomycetota bacterium]
MHLVYNAALDIRDVAEQLGIPEGTVKSRMYHARRHIAHRFAQERAKLALVDVASLDKVSIELGELGVEALAIEKAILKQPKNGESRRFVEDEITPPEWAPWSLMASGAVVVLYSFTIPRRISS